jgi:predicted RNase H-like HicB family nuclease
MSVAFSMIIYYNIFSIVFAKERFRIMVNKKFIYYREDDMWIGWLEDYPDYRTQGESLDELKENLTDIYQDLTGGFIPCVHQVGELAVG